jgi:hypothetical protein
MISAKKHLRVNAPGDICLQVVISIKAYQTRTLNQGICVDLKKWGRKMGPDPISCILADCVMVSYCSCGITL